ncbi:hypothetical protein [Paraburkholderia bannensis]|uniref:hypothetical protein n=1 Tax=Paraburkholderia bannensis TaxID=765414 RepID=UPI002AC3272C|nr:hypothetical protein [Paraburkholderia bannensis]
MNRFHVRAEAALAIATHLYPDDEIRQRAATENYAAAIYDALCAGEIVGHDPENLLPIRRRGDLTAGLMLAGCLIAIPAINAWLAERHIDIQLDAAPACEPSQPSEPSPAELLAEKHRLPEHIRERRCNVLLGKKYGIPPHRVKYLCGKAEKAQKSKLGAATTPFFEIQKVLSGKRV